jgi:hypothetical protein
VADARAPDNGRAVVTIDDVRPLALRPPRTTEPLGLDPVKFRVGRIVYLAFSRDETQIGFAFPKDWREVLVGSAYCRRARRPAQTWSTSSTAALGRAQRRFGRS